MRSLFLVLITVLSVSCNRDVEFDAILQEGPAPESVQANITFNNMTAPFMVVVTPTSIGATTFEVLSGLPGATVDFVGIGEEVLYTYPESEDPFFVTVRAIAPNGKVTEQIFEVVPPADPCEQIFGQPATWDDGSIAFSFGFNGVELATVANPDPSGDNPEESNVLQITQDGGGNFDGYGVQMNQPIDFSADDKIVRLKFWSDTELPLRLTVQQDPNNASEREAEVTVIHTGSGWEELRFDFNSATAGFTGSSALGIPDGASFIPTGQYIRFQMFISPGNDLPGTFYLDDVGLCP